MALPLSILSSSAGITWAQAVGEENATPGNPAAIDATVSPVGGFAGLQLDGSPLFHGIQGAPAPTVPVSSRLPLRSGINVISADMPVASLTRLAIPEKGYSLAPKFSREGRKLSVFASFRHALKQKVSAIARAANIFDNETLKKNSPSLPDPISYGAAGGRSLGFRKPTRVEPGLDKAPSPPKKTLTQKLRDETRTPLGVARTGRGESRQIRPDPLPGNPQDGLGIEKALQQLIATNPELFNGLKLENFVTADIQRQAGILEMYYVNFALKINDLFVDGALLRFQVQMVDGKAMLVGIQHPSYPPANLNPDGVLTPVEIRGKITERLGFPPESYPNHQEYSRRILPWNNKWHVADVFYLAGRKQAPRLVAVDVNDPKETARVWDPHSYFKDRKLNPLEVVAAADRSGTAEGKGVLDGPILDLKNLDLLPLGDLEITNVDTGEKFFSDDTGKFVVPGSSGKKVHLRFGLTGKAVDVHDARGDDKNLVFDGVFESGQELRVVVNKEGLDKHTVAQVNGYVHPTIFHQFVSKYFNFNLRQIRHNVNIQQDCNAFYDGNSINTFDESSQCQNTTYDDVIYHELGHFFDDSAGLRLFLALVRRSLFAVLDGGFSEGFGDWISITIISQRLGRPMPTLGRHFLKKTSISDLALWIASNAPRIGKFFVKDYVRDARNKHPFDPAEEVHDQGLVYGGVAYKLQINLLERFLREKLAGISFPNKEKAVQDVIGLFRTDESVAIEDIYQQLDAKLKELGKEFEKVFHEAFGKAWEVATNLAVPVVFAKPSDIPAAVQQIVLRSIGADGKSLYFDEIKAAAAAHQVEVTLPRKFGEQGLHPQWLNFDRLGKWTPPPAH